MGPDTPLVVLGNGVDLSGFTATHDRTIWRGQEVDRHAFLFLFVGRLSSVKGPERALEAFFEIAGQCPNAGLVYAGEGPLRRDLEERVAAQPKLRARVHFVGSVALERMPVYYQGADALIVSSRHEGTPNCVLEAISAGLPVVSVPVGGIPDLVAAGAPLSVVAENEPRALAEGMKSLYEEAQAGSVPIRRGRDWAETHLDWDRIVDAYEQFYQQILAV